MSDYSNFTIMLPEKYGTLTITSVDLQEDGTFTISAQFQSKVKFGYVENLTFTTYLQDKDPFGL